MWFPSDMAVFDFTVRITRFGVAQRAHPLVRAIAEIFDRLGIDHLLVDLNRDGDMAWSDVYVTDPIVIRGSCSLTCGLDGQVKAAASRLLPDAAVSVEWYARDPGHGRDSSLERDVERVSRMFGGLCRGLVPARVRLAILDPDGYVARHGNGRSRGDLPGVPQLAMLALTEALGEAGARLGIDWSGQRRAVAMALESLRQSIVEVPSCGGCGLDGRVQGGAWTAVDELEVAAVGPVDPLVAETADHLNAVMFDAIRDALVLVSPEFDLTICGEQAADELDCTDLIESPEWTGELVMSAPDARAPYLLR